MALEGLVATTVTLRWGSYFAVLADHDKPVSLMAASSSNASRISDGEMARINIEVSAALAEWIDISRVDDGREYRELLGRAVAHLPMAYPVPKVKTNPLMLLADPEFADQLVSATEAGYLARVRADAEQAPTRLLANALVNFAWRNGPIEEIHAGRTCNYPRFVASLRWNDRNAPGQSRSCHSGCRMRL